jgi:hypothetical protein
MNKEDLILESDGEYTTYKNLDIEMVEKIKKTPQPSLINYGNHKKSELVSYLNDTQLLFVDEKKEHFILEKKKLDEIIIDNILEKINTDFNVVDAIGKTFKDGLYSEDGFIQYFFRKGGIFGNDFKSCGYTECGYDVSTYDGITIKVEELNERSSIAFAYLNEDGNIVCRDYNIDIKKYIGNKPATKHDLIKVVIENIPDVPYQNYGNKWFAKDFALSVSGADVYRYSRSSGDNYGDSRSGRIKLPKNTVEVTRNNILSKLLPAINDLPLWDKVDLSEYIKPEEIIEIVEIPKLRVQKTKLKVKE